MTEREIIELYKKEIELFLAPLHIVKGETIINTEANLNDQNKAFIKQKMNEIKAGNFDKDLMDKAIDELLPYLRQID